MAAFNPPASIRPILERIASLAAEDALEAIVVGGTVRDVLLGREPHDVDIAVDRDAMPFAQRLAAALGGHFVPLDDANAVARVVLDDGAVRSVDVAQLHGTLEEDARRRDFTIDALAAPLTGGGVIDFVGGLRDLELRTVRMNTASAFDDDPLRLLRGVRIAAELHFALEAETERTIRDGAPRVLEAAAERRRDELARILTLDDSCDGVRHLDRTGLLDALFPELTFGRGVTQPGGFHAYDVFEHNLHCLRVVDLIVANERPDAPGAWLRDEVWAAFGWCKRELREYLRDEPIQGRTRATLLRLAALLHDVAKPQTREVTDDGNAHFYGHADLGAEIAARVMRRFRFSSRETQFVTTLVREHLRPTQLAQVGEVPTRRALYRFYRALGEVVPAVLLLSIADGASARGLDDEIADASKSEGWLRHVRYVNSLLVRSAEEEGIVDAPRLMDGHDIMSSLGIGPGPLIGRLLEALEEAQAAGEISGRDEALAFVRRQAGEDVRRAEGP